MSGEMWLTVAAIPVLVIAWVGNYFGWFQSKHGRGTPDGAAPTLQGSQLPPTDLGSHH